MSAGDPGELKITLCPKRPVQVTWPPAPMSTREGANDVPEVPTFAVDGKTAFTLIARNDDTTALPSVAVAVMVADPGATPVTRPPPETVALVLSELVHPTEAAIGFPFWSRGVAVSCRVAPAFTEVPPVTDTLVSTAGAELTVTRRVALSDLPANVA
jgi:hypothetical protein